MIRNYIVRSKKTGKLSGHEGEIPDGKFDLNDGKWVKFSENSFFEYYHKK